MKIKCFDIAVAVSLFLCILLVVSFENDCKGIRENVLRFHIIADSDSESAQNLKLKIRDEVLLHSEELFSLQDTLQSATAKATESLQEIEEIANDVIKKENADYTAKAFIGKSYFPTREYEGGITFPAGYYNALKIVLGSGKGKNWWCVMFPSICLGAATDKKAMLGEVLDEKQMEIIESDPKYEVRFWIVEKYYEVKERARRK